MPFCARSAVVFLMTLLFIAPSPALAGGKVALVIGNSNYIVTQPLNNPSNDGDLVALSAKKAGFSVVQVEKNTTLDQFNQSLRRFRTLATGADVAMIYYAGHGIEDDGKNWLIPIDAKLENELDLPYESVELSRLLEAVSGSKLRIVIIDACRNNPFGKSWKTRTRSVSRGLAEIEADDILIIFAAAPGQTALDGDGRNSPFATSLAIRLAQPDLPVQMLGGLIRDDVLSATGGSQRPYVSASITGKPIYLVQSVIIPEIISAASLFRQQLGASISARADRSRSPEALGDRSYWIVQSDYPPAALASGHKGRVVFNLAIDKSGKIETCSIESSSGFKELDDRTCEILTKRAKFAPAVGADEMPTAGSFRGSIVWSIGVIDGLIDKSDLSM